MLVVLELVELVDSSLVVALVVLVVLVLEMVLHHLLFLHNQVLFYSIH